MVTQTDTSTMDSTTLTQEVTSTPDQPAFGSFALHQQSLEAKRAEVISFDLHEDEEEQVGDISKYFI